jgi:hypothetical protein
LCFLEVSQRGVFLTDVKETSLSDDKKIYAEYFEGLLEGRKRKVYTVH